MVTSVSNRAGVHQVPAAHQTEKMIVSSKQAQTTEYNDYVNEFLPPPNRKLFDVTCVIGSVYAGGEVDARTVAYMMIADHNAEGTFSFPMEDGGIEHVTVERERENPS